MFDTNQYIRQRRARLTEANPSEDPLAPPTFGEMRFTRVPDTATSGAIAGALLTSWKCKLLLRSGVPFLSLKFLTSRISSCPPRRCYIRSFLRYPSGDWKRVWRATGKIHLKEADAKPNSPAGRKLTLRTLDATLIQVDWLPTCCTRRVSVSIETGEGCVPGTNCRTREADRGGKTQRIVACV